MRDFIELRDEGLLWLINTTVFHPRGYAMQMHIEDGKAVGWSLIGDGTVPFCFLDEADAIDDCFRRVSALLSGSHDG